MVFTRMSAIDAEGRIDLWNRAYEGYAVAAHFDALTLERMRALGDLVDEHSPVLLEDRVPVAFGALGLRGDRAWLGGFGVTASHRRRGLGARTLIEWFAVARACGATSARLEVLEPNVAAHALYEAHGFLHTRWLEVWSAVAPDDDAPRGIEQVAPEEALACLERLPGPAEPWQRESSSVRNLGSAALGLVRGDPADPDAAAIVVPVPEARRVSILRLRARAGASRQANLTAMLDAVIAFAPGGTMRWINVAPEDPAIEVLRARGGTLEIRQHEMARDL